MTDSQAVGDHASRAMEAESQQNRHEAFSEKAEDDQEPVSYEGDQLAFQRSITGWRWALAIIAINAGSFLYGLDNTIVADIQAAVVGRFGEAGKLAWIGSAFPLGSVALLLTTGKAYSIFNIKWLWIASIVIFEAGSALCGAAPTMNALIIGRVIAGAGGAGMYLGGLNLMSVNTTIRERPGYMALNGVVWGAGTILGPVIGGKFADSSATWRWAFYINLVIGAIASPVIFFLIPGFQPQPNTSLTAKLKQIDWLGTVLYAGVYTSWVLALTFGGNQWAWGDGRTIAVFVVFGVSLLAFTMSQQFCILTSRGNRIFPGHFLARRTMVLLYILTATAATALFVPIYYLPLFFQFVHADTAIRAAVRLLPFILVVVFFTIVNGGAMPKFGYYMPWFVFSSVLILIGGALMTTIHPGTSVAKIYGYTILIAAGAGSTTQAAYSIAPAKVHDAGDIPAAVAFINVAQIGAIVIALTISGTIFQNLSFNGLTEALRSLNLSPSDIRSAISGSQSTVMQNLDPVSKAAALNVITAAINRVYLLVVAAGALGLVCSLALKREKLFMTTHAGG